MWETPVRVQVLMATRNGARHLAQQVASICSQRGVDVDLLVLDDGSTDRTVKVAHEAATGIPVRVVETPHRIGLPGVFLELLRLADPDRDLWAFADQDDVWLPDKLRFAADSLATCHASTPALWVCGLSWLGDRPSGSPHSVREPAHLRHSLTMSGGAGCCMVWNDALRQRISLPAAEDIVMHDWWMYLSAQALGAVIHDPLPLVQYRIHTGNSVGVDGSLRSRIRRHMSSHVSGRGTWESQALALLRAYGSDLPDRDRAAAEALAFGGRTARLSAWVRGDLTRPRTADNLQLLARLMLLRPRLGANRP